MRVKSLQYKLKYIKVGFTWITAPLFIMVKKRDSNKMRDHHHESPSQAPRKDSLKKYKHDYSTDVSDKSWPYRYGKMDRSGKIIVTVFPILIASVVGYLYYQSSLRDLVKTPLSESLITGLSATSAQHDPERFWGTYRSNLYFGLKTRTERSPVFGLMWMSQMGGERLPPIRHWCDQGDGIPMYGWFAHDGVNFGIQEIFDNYFTVSTDFVKRPGGDHGGDWSARFKINPRANISELAVSLFFYVALDGQGEIQAKLKKRNQIQTIVGTSEELGKFELLFPEIDNPDKVKYNSFVTYANGLDKLKEKLMEGFGLHSWDKKRNLQYVGLTGTHMPKDIPVSQANFIVHQVTAQLPFEMSVLFESGSYMDRGGQLKGALYQQYVQSYLTAFTNKFDETFALNSKSLPEEQIHFGKACLSNMLGSIGYFYGSSLVRSKHTPNNEVVEYWRSPLYSGVPSRSFFPRGFLWDEGFHNLLIEKWNQSISMDIIGHWLDLMNAEGWIPREQILGPEARARVPSEFVIQHNENANPPTLFLPLQSIVKNLIKSDDPRDKLYLQKLFPRLKVWYNWFNTTQSGPKPFTYRWRGRHADAKKEINPKTLTSGLDDYPRASHPTDEEYHLDLRCWMALASGVMADIARAIHEPADAYQYTYDILRDNKLLDELHWSSSQERYSDYGLHTDSVKLVRPKPPPLKSGQRPPPPADKERQTFKEPKYRLVDSHFGYISLFPFLLRLIEPDSLKLGKILTDIHDPNLIWTKYGLRSLAKNSPLYSKHNTEHDPPYWRGYIWINMNYLAIGALHHYANIPGPYQENALNIYSELRTNVIDNLFHVYKTTGYIWENYDDKDGKGKGCHPFTGWSALVVAIMAEQY